MSYQSFGTGVRRRSKPRLIHVNGYTGQSTSKRSVQRPIYNGQAIMSGMCVSEIYDNGQWKFQKGVNASDIHAPVFIAHQDYNEPDVLASGILEAFPLSDTTREYRTGYFKTGTTAAPDDEGLIASFKNGKLVSAFLSSHADAGSFKIAESTQIVVGAVAGAHYDSPIDIASEALYVTPDADGKVLVLQFGGAFVPGQVAA